MITPIPLGTTTAQEGTASVTAAKTPRAMVMIKAESQIANSRAVHRLSPMPTTSNVFSSVIVIAVRLASIPASTVW